jgi:tetratricopeptide (TPR) repeat protein
MGRKHFGARQLLYLCFAGVTCFLFLGCSTPKVSKDIQVTEAVPATKTLPEGRADPVPEKEIRAVCPTPESQAPPALPPVSPLPLLSPLPPVSPQPPPAAVQTPTPPAGEEPPRFGSPKVQRARKLLAQKDYEASLKLSEKVLLQSGSQGAADEALFSLGLIYAHQENPRKDYAKALGYFQRLLKEYPKSSLAEEAKAWAGVLQENQNLKQVIEKTKEVDIAVDEKRREKGR